MKDDADTFNAMHLQELPDPEKELNRAFGYLVEKRATQTSDDVTGCTSCLQRKLGCGYNRAANLIELMEKRFWITASDEKGARKIIRPNG